MGRKGSGKGVRRDFVLDAGALIALERDNRRLRATLHSALALHAEIVVPATALAQTWRGGPRSAPLAKLVGKSEVDLLDEGRAKETGERIGSRGTSDVADAHVFCCALERQAVIVTSDPSDMEALAGANESLALIGV